MRRFLGKRGYSSTWTVNRACVPSGETFQQQCMHCATDMLVEGVQLAVPLLDGPSPAAHAHHDLKQLCVRMSALILISSFSHRMQSCRIKMISVVYTAGPSAYIHSPLVDDRLARARDVNADPHGVPEAL